MIKNEELLSYVTELAVSTSGLKSGVYAISRLGNNVDNLITKLCLVFEQATIDQRKTISDLLDKSIDHIVLMYGQRMAMIGVRNKALGDIHTALIALCMISQHVDERDIIMALSVIHDAASRVGTPETQFISATKAAWNAARRDLILDFLRRDIEDKSISAMGYQSFEGPNGIVYWFGGGEPPDELLKPALENART